MSNKTAVILLNWNGYKDTIECIESLFTSDELNFKVYLLDNGSSNESYHILYKKYGRDSRVAVFKSMENLGFAAGNNFLIRKAIDEGFDYIWILNNDTTLMSTTLSALVKCMENSTVGLLGSVLYEYYQPWKIQAFGGGKFSKFLGTTSNVYSNIDNLDHIIGASMFFRASVLRKIGLLDERLFFYLEDTEISLRTHDNGFSIGVCKDSYVFHKGGSSVNSGVGERSERSERYYIRSVIDFMRIRKYSDIRIFCRILAMFLNRALNRKLHFSNIVYHEFKKWLEERKNVV